MTDDIADVPKSEIRMVPDTELHDLRARLAAVEDDHAAEVAALKEKHSAERQESCDQALADAVKLRADLEAKHYDELADEHAEIIDLGNRLTTQASMYESRIIKERDVYVAIVQQKDTALDQAGSRITALGVTVKRLNDDLAAAKTGRTAALVGAGILAFGHAVRD